MNYPKRVKNSFFQNHNLSSSSPSELNSGCRLPSGEHFPAVVGLNDLLVPCGKTELQNKEIVLRARQGYLKRNERYLAFARPKPRKLEPIRAVISGLGERCTDKGANLINESGSPLFIITLVKRIGP